MTQLALPLKSDVQAIDAGVVSKQPTMTQALMLAQQMSGLSDKEVAHALKLDTAQWARIKTGASYFPQDKLDLFCEITGNEAPLQWWAQRRGYALVLLETEHGRQLRLEREKNERLAAENELLRKLVVGRPA